MYQVSQICYWTRLRTPAGQRLWRLPATPCQLICPSNSSLLFYMSGTVLGTDQFIATQGNSSVEWKSPKCLYIPADPLCLKLPTPAGSPSLRRNTAGVSCSSVGLAGVNGLWQRPSLRAEGDSPLLLHLCPCDWSQLWGCQGLQLE